MCGSSPPARGTFVGAQQINLAVRFIPTSAGNIWFRSRRSSFAAVHPHQRGEHLRLAHEKKGIGGSSPPARGTSLFVRSGLVSGRFIPTSAGNIGKGGCCKHPPTVHPHQRGEHTNHNGLISIGKTNHLFPTDYITVFFHIVKEHHFILTHWFI